VHYFELVFDHDWDLTRTRIQDPLYIRDTFVHPKVEDEENNWANRARILEAYRELKALVESRGIRTGPEFFG
jgi:hypothetical protein